MITAAVAVQSIHRLRRTVHSATYGTDLDVGPRRALSRGRQHRVEALRDSRKPPRLEYRYVRPQASRHGAPGLFAGTQSPLSAFVTAVAFWPRVRRTGRGRRRSRRSARAEGSIRPRGRSRQLQDGMRGRPRVPVLGGGRGGSGWGLRTRLATRRGQPMCRVESMCFQLK